MTGLLLGAVWVAVECVCLALLAAGLLLLLAELVHRADETSRRHIDVHAARARDMPWSLTDEPARGTEAQR